MILLSPDHLVKVNLLQVLHIHLCLYSLPMLMTWWWTAWLLVLHYSVYACCWVINISIWIMKKTWISVSVEVSMNLYLCMFCTSVGLLLVYCETACCWLHADGCDAVLHPIFLPCIVECWWFILHSFFNPVLIVRLFWFKSKTKIQKPKLKCSVFSFQTNWSGAVCWKPKFLQTE